MWLCIYVRLKFLFGQESIENSTSQKSIENFLKNLAPHSALKLKVNILQSQLTCSVVKMMCRIQMRRERALSVIFCGEYLGEFSATLGASYSKVDLLKS